MKSWKHRLTLAGIALMMLLVAISSGMLTSKSLAYDGDYGNNVSYADTGIYDEITRYSKKEGIDINEYETIYATNVQYKSNLIASDELIITGDDPITKWVPKELFMKEGKTFYVGVEYGFLVDSFVPMFAEEIHSTVMLFRIFREDNQKETYNRIKITITQLFQGEFAYVTGTTKEVSVLDLLKGINGFAHPSYLAEKVKPNIQASGTGFVVPVPSLKKFVPFDRYYLTNFASTVSLYNKNHVNAFSENIINGDYRVEEDYGAYFSQVDLSYDANSIKKGDERWADKTRLTYDAASVAWDVLEQVKDIGEKLKKLGGVLGTAAKVIPVVGVGVSAIDIASDLASIQSSSGERLVSEVKESKYIPDYTDRALQVERGYLNKDMTLALKAVEGRQLYLSKGKHITFDYQVSVHDSDIDTRYMTALYMGAVPIVTVDVGTHAKTLRFGETISAVGVHSFDLNLKGNDYVEILEFQEEQNNNFHILPQQQSLKSFVPQRRGEYTFTGESSLYYYARISIYEKGATPGALGRLVATSTHEGNRIVIKDVWLDYGKDYYIVADLKGDDSIKGFYGKVTVKSDFTPPFLTAGDNQLNISSNQDTYYRFRSSDFSHYDFVVSGGQAVISILGNNYTVVQQSNNGFLSRKLAPNSDYYLKISSDSTAPINVSIKAKKNVVFDSVGGTPINDIQFSTGENISLPTPVRQGYKFLGWGRTANTTHYLTGADLHNYDFPDIYLYANWSAIVYNINYVENGGTDIEDATYTYEQSIWLDKSITKAGYVFAGWYDNASFTGKPIEFIGMGNLGDKTFYAKWEKAKGIISLDVNVQETDGEPAYLSAYEKQVPNGEHYSLPVPVLEGFLFEGWFAKDYVDTNGQAYSNYQFTDREGYSLRVFDGQNTQLSAKWSRETYYFQINYDQDGTQRFIWLSNNGLTGQKEPLSYYYNFCPNCMMKEIDRSTIYRVGHVFEALVIDLNNPQNIFCWDIHGKSINDGDEIKLYAHYRKERNFKIDFYDYSESELASIEADYGKEIKLPTLEQEGKEFSHWEVTDYIKNQKYNGTVFAIGSEFDYSEMPDLSVNEELDGEIIFLSAVFVNKNYKITLVSEGQKTQVKEVEYGVTKAGFPVLAKLGYTFEGWQNSDEQLIVDKDGLVIDKDGKNVEWFIAEDIKLAAKWMPKEYTITFRDGTNEHVRKIKFGESLQAPSATMDFHDGVWKAKGNSGEITVAFGDSWTQAYDKDIAFEVSWSPRVYTLNFVNLPDMFVLSRKYAYEPKNSLDKNIDKMWIVVHGFYRNSSYTETFNVKASERGTINVYVIWEELIGVGRLTSGKIKVTDGDPFNHTYFDLETSYSTYVTGNMYGNMHPYRSIKLDFTITMREKDDGYQHLYIYNQFNKSSQVFHELVIEHGPGKKKTELGTYTFSLTFDVSIASTEHIYVLFGASGFGADNWYIEGFRVDVSYSTDLPRTSQNPTHLKG